MTWYLYLIFNIRDSENESIATKEAPLVCLQNASNKVFKHIDCNYYRSTDSVTLIVSYWWCPQRLINIFNTLLSNMPDIAASAVWSFEKRKPPQSFRWPAPVITPFTSPAFILFVYTGTRCRLQLKKNPFRTIYCTASWFISNALTTVTTNAKIIRFEGSKIREKTTADLFVKNYSPSLILTCSINIWTERNYSNSFRILLSVESTHNIDAE